MYLHNIDYGVIVDHCAFIVDLQIIKYHYFFQLYDATVLILKSGYFSQFSISALFTVYLLYCMSKDWSNFNSILITLKYFLDKQWKEEEKILDRTAIDYEAITILCEILGNMLEMETNKN